MLKFKSGPTPDITANYEVMPDLAASYELPTDGSQLTFKLQPNAKWHNIAPVNGRALTAEDVKASFDRFRAAPKNTNKAAFGTDSNPLVTGVETPDARAVVFKLARPYAPILNLFANPTYLWILPKEADNGYDPSKQQIGSGPYAMDQFQPDVSYTLKKNPDYYVQGKPYINGVSIVIIPDTAQQVAQYQAGKLDWYTLPAENKDAVMKSNPQTNLLTYTSGGFNFGAPQQRGNTPFKDPRVRRALSMAMDRDSIVKLRFAGQGGHYNTSIPSSMGRWWQDPKAADAGPGGQWVKYDPKAARDLLTAAGMDNMPLRFIYTNNAYGDPFNQEAEVYAGMLKEAGFNVTLVQQDYLREYIDAKGTFFGNYEGMFYGPQTPFTDPHDYLFNMSHPKSARNNAGISDERLTAMIDDEEKTLDEAARVNKVKEIQRYQLDQMFYIPGVVGSAYTAVQPWVHNFFYSGTYGFGVETHLDIWTTKS
jgi:peptide/nickel transport system substrate-binding protein